MGLDVAQRAPKTQDPAGLPTDGGPNLREATADAGGGAACGDLWHRCTPDAARDLCKTNSCGNLQTQVPTLWRHTAWPIHMGARAAAPHRNADGAGARLLATVPDSAKRRDEGAVRDLAKTPLWRR